MERSFPWKLSCMQFTEEGFRFIGPGVKETMSGIAFSTPFLPGWVLIGVQQQERGILWNIIGSVNGRRCGAFSIQKLRKEESNKILLEYSVFLKRQFSRNIRCIFCNIFRVCSVKDTMMLMEKRQQEGDS